MNLRLILLFTYREMLRLYPANFKEHFADEMVEIATAARLKEWPLIFCDTGIGVVRSWLFADSSESNGQGVLLQLPTSAVRPFQLIEGFVLAIMLVLAASCLSTQTVWNLPSCHTDGSCAPVIASQIAR